MTVVLLGKTTFQVTTSAGRCLSTYDLRRGLNLVFLTRPETPRPITATRAWKDVVLAAWGGGGGGGGGGGAPDEQGVWVFRRGKKVAELERPMDAEEPLRQLLVFGSWIVGCGATRLEVWRTGSYEHYTTIQPAAAGPGLGTHTLSGVMCNVPTLLNKILVGRSDGGVELWNISVGCVTVPSPSPLEREGVRH